MIKTKKTKKKNSKLGMKKKEAITFYILISPFIIMLFVYRLFPFLWGVVMSMTNYTGFNYDKIRFIGLKNFTRIFTDNFAIEALTATLEIGLITVPMGLLVSLALALLLNTKIKGAGVFRTIYYFPAIIPFVATGMMWRILYNTNGGAFNTVLSYFGMPEINWLGQEWCRRSLIIYMAWGAGGGILTYLAALKNVSPELYESAEIDGATGFKKLLYITMPMISSVIFFNLVNGFIAAWQLFNQPTFLAASSGSILSVPYKPNYVYLVHVYQQIFVNQRFGYGLALVWILFIMSFLFTKIVFYTSKFWVFDEQASSDMKKKKSGKKNQQNKSSLAAKKVRTE